MSQVTLIQLKQALPTHQEYWRFLCFLLPFCVSKSAHLTLVTFD